MASSAHKHHHLFPNLHGGATTAPPPTPSANQTSLLSTSDAADALSRLLHRLPPNLSLPTNRRSATTSSSSSAATATCPPSISLSDNSTDILSSFSQLGFVQLTDHSVPSELANSAESESLALFDLPQDQKESSFPKNWPLGYEPEEADEDENDDELGLGLGESFRLDSSCSTESSTQLILSSLREFSLSLEKLGLKIVDELMKGLGLENPIGNDPTRWCSILWISEDRPGNRPEYSGGFYPYVVALQYQIRREKKYSLLSDSGWVHVVPHVDSILVTLGDIAQVWSNGKLKKVRGRAMGEAKESRCITMSLLITLPTETTVAPLLFLGNEDQKEEEKAESDEEHGRVFHSFDFEDYAWRVYHERLLFKDPLDRYRLN
ncbi:1-aminocyclopropane-1-carboxylate oxidase 2 [Arachis stenosperma]|uniref:1-aminocyclopropane-1-carboxylate oxidase 2 n=1 Tax=Arachis stenosperma TaxID=217475 RepID=UPI0025AC9530|nr:1-aminocyclopropane-1-carboxylate oxidase 2 [Arachis stenosperma]